MLPLVNEAGAGQLYDMSNFLFEPYPLQSSKNDDKSDGPSSLPVPLKKGSSNQLSKKKIQNNNKFEFDFVQNGKHKQIYDMSVFLSEPHPFQQMFFDDDTGRPSNPRAQVEEESTFQLPIQQKNQDDKNPVGSSVKTGEDESGVWRLEVQNEDSLSIDIFEAPMDDLFLNDKVESGHLTWGWRLSFTPNSSDPDWFEDIRNAMYWPSNIWKARASYSLQQSAYTPNTYTQLDGLADRPWAGYVLANARLNLEREFVGNVQYLDRLNLGLGIVGPLSFGEKTHKLFHDVMNRSSRSWTELDSEPVVVVQYDTGKRMIRQRKNSNFGFEAYPYVGVTLGNAYTYASLGLSARFGLNLKKDSGPLRSNLIMSGTNFPQPGNYFSWNLFAGVEGRYIGHNIFVDGNTYTDNSDVSSKNKVADVQLGGEIGWGEKRFSLLHVRRTEEFSGQITPDQFIRVGVSSDFSAHNLKKINFSDGPLWEVISEARLGFLSHDVRFPSRHQLHAPNPFENRYESGINFNPEIVFISPKFLSSLQTPRPHVGFSLNLDDDTSSIYAGLGWDRRWANNFFLDGFLGLAAHDGELKNGNPDKIEFGSEILFRLGGELGWRWDGSNGLSLVWEHMSNAGLIDDKNQGIDSLGIRYSFRFD